MNSEVLFSSIVIIGAVALWLTCVVNMFLALKRRRPGVSLWSAPLYRPSLLTERGVKSLVRYYLAGGGFVVWICLGAFIHKMLFP
jgi:hypothetical protein